MPEPLLVVVPGHWAPLAEHLAARGHPVYGHVGGRPSYNWYGRWTEATAAYGHIRQAFADAWAGAVDLEKTTRAVDDGGPLADHLAALPDKLASAAVLGDVFERVVRDKGIGAVVVVCSYDATGRTAVLAGKRAGVPVVHVAHSCQSAAPADAWYAARDPGDVLCVPGERDADWWRTCLDAFPELAPADLTIETTGHALWDGYAGLTRNFPVKGTPQRVLWACESGDSPAQTEAIWHSRAVPTMAWQAFLEAGRRERWAVVLKGRIGESGERRHQWEAEAREALGAERVRYTDAAPQDVLPNVDVAVVQDSNLGVEALKLGIPVVSITRNGGCLFSDNPAAGVWVVDGVNGGRPDLGDRIRYAVGAALEHTDFPLCRAESVRYDGGTGTALARVAEVIEGVAQRA